VTRCPFSPPQNSFRLASAPRDCSGPDAPCRESFEAAVGFGHVAPQLVLVRNDQRNRRISHAGKPRAPGHTIGCCRSYDSGARPRRRSCTRAARLTTLILQNSFTRLRPLWLRRHGDRGFLHTELTRSATAEEAEEVRARKFDAYLGSNRACEIGLSLATGQEHESFIYLLEE
jgi:hypothetical protein